RFVLMTLDNVTLTGRFPIAGHRPKSRYRPTITARPAADREDPETSWGTSIPSAAGPGRGFDRAVEPGGHIPHLQEARIRFPPACQSALRRRVEQPLRDGDERSHGY